MEDLNFDWLDGDCVLIMEPPKFRLPRTRSVTEQADQPSGERALPLLRLSSWESNK